MNRRSFIARLLGLPIAVALAPLVGKIVPAVDAAVTPAVETTGTTGLIDLSAWGPSGTSSGTYTYDFSSVLLENLKMEQSALLNIDLYATATNKDSVAYWREDMLS